MANEVYNAPQKGAAKSAEYSTGKNAVVQASGLYRHEATGKEVFVQGDPLYGNAQAQGFVRLGFVFVRELQPGDVKSIPEMSATTRDTSDLKGLAARLDALEAENAKLRAEAEVSTDKAPKEKHFTLLNKTELLELAEQEGIELPEDADTNAKIREAITNARVEKEGK